MVEVRRKLPRMDQDIAGGGKHRAEHVDQADKGAADPDHAAADLFEHAGDRHRLAFGRRRGLHAAHFVRQDWNSSPRGRRSAPRRRCVAEAAAQTLDQPGAESVEAGDLRDVDEDVGPAAAELFGVGDDFLQHRGMAGDPGTGRATAQARCPVQSAPVSGRRSRCPLRRHRPAGCPREHAACRPSLRQSVMYQPLSVTASRRRFRIIRL